MPERSPSSASTSALSEEEGHGIVRNSHRQCQAEPWRVERRNVTIRTEWQQSFRSRAFVVSGHFRPDSARCAQHDTKSQRGLRRPKQHLRRSFRKRRPSWRIPSQRPPSAEHRSAAVGAVSLTSCSVVSSFRLTAVPPAFLDFFVFVRTGLTSPGSKTSAGRS